MRTETSTAVALEGLEVRYGRRVAVDGVSLSVAPGQVYALLGRNGAGKSSLVRCALGLQRPRKGRAMLLGEDAWKRRAAVMKEVGVMGEEPDMPDTLSAEALSRYCAPLYDRWDGAGFLDRLHRVGVDTERPCGQLSRGQRAQVALGLALAHQPRLLVLDDPTLGLDAVARRAFFETLVTDLADRGAAVLLTSHDLAGVEGLADRVGFMVDGRLVLEDDMEALKARFRRVRWEGEAGALEGLGTLARARRPWGHEAVVQAFEPEALPMLDRLEVETMSLEDIFVAVTGPDEVMA